MQVALPGRDSDSSSDLPVPFFDSAAGTTAQAKPSAPAAGTGSFTSDPEGVAGPTVELGWALEVVQVFLGAEASCCSK